MGDDMEHCYSTFQSVTVIHIELTNVALDLCMSTAHALL
jgi:hypothetical protein